MKRIVTLATAALILAACQDAGPVTAPNPALSNQGVANPNTQVNLRASFETTMLSFLSDGSSVAGAPAVHNTAHVDLALLGESGCVSVNNAGIPPFIPATTTTTCITALSVPVEYMARCEAQTFTLGSLSIPFDGVLTAYARASLPTVSFTVTTTRTATGAIYIPSPINPLTLSDVDLEALAPYSPALAALIMGVLQDQDLPIGEELQVGFLARDRTTTDIPAPDALLALIQPLLENPDLISNPLDPALLELVLQPEVLELLRTVFPLFIPPAHAYHPACATTQEKTIRLRFDETANWVQPNSGNEHLNFRAFTPHLQPFAGAIHYNRPQNRSTADGYLLSNSGLFFIDLAQLKPYQGNLVQNLANGGVPVRACMTALPWKCVDTNLSWQQ